MILKNYLKNPFKYTVLSLADHGHLKGLSDKAYVKLIFHARTGKRLRVKNPQTFNEKLQWIKLYDRKPSYTQLVDKYAVRKHIAHITEGLHLIPIVGGPWNSFDEIDFEKLPDQFVLKCNHDSGGLVICRDKSQLDIEKAKKKIERSLSQNYYKSSREWVYKDVKPCIIAEMYMEDENEAAGLTDYKFFCFNGKPKMIYVSQGLEDHKTASISFYDLQGCPMPFRRSDYKPIEGEMKLPANFEEMTQTAEKIAKMVDCPFVRVDLYSIRGKMYFSEITFFPCGGMVPFEPKEWDYKLGEWIALPKR